MLEAYFNAASFTSESQVTSMVQTDLSKSVPMNPKQSVWDTDPSLKPNATRVTVAGQRLRRE